jgi:hypothetical protein
VHSSCASDTPPKWVREFNIDVYIWILMSPL